MINLILIFEVSQQDKITQTQKIHNATVAVLNTILNSTKSNIDAISSTYQVNIQTSQYLSIIAIGCCCTFGLIIISCDLGKLLSSLDVIKGLKKSILRSFDVNIQNKVSDENEKSPKYHQMENKVPQEYTKDYKNKIINYERKFLQEYKKVNANKVK